MIKKREDIGKIFDKSLLLFIIFINLLFFPSYAFPCCVAAFLGVVCIFFSVENSLLEKILNSKAYWI